MIPKDLLIGLHLPPGLADQLGTGPVAKTGTTLSVNDNGQILTYSGAAGVTWTIPAGIGLFECAVVQLGAGQVTLSAAAGVTLNSFGSFTKTAGQFAVISIFAVALDTFILAGSGA